MLFVFLIKRTFKKNIKLNLFKMIEEEESEKNVEETHISICNNFKNLLHFSYY